MAREGEPSWTSDLGEGRPGWHVECAAIALNRLGDQYDVQGGGSDLAFPHHEFGSAHAEALTGAHPLARHYCHAGMIGLDGEKMSKSKGNLVFVSRLRADRVDPMAVRLALMSGHWRADRSWTADLLTGGPGAAAPLARGGRGPDRARPRGHDRPAARAPRRRPRHARARSPRSTPGPTRCSCAAAAKGGPPTGRRASPTPPTPCSGSRCADAGTSARMAQQRPRRRARRLQSRPRDRLLPQRLLRDRSRRRGRAHRVRPRHRGVPDLLRGARQRPDPLRRRLPRADSPATAGACARAAGRRPSRAASPRRSSSRPPTPARSSGSTSPTWRSTAIAE